MNIRKEGNGMKIYVLDRMDKVDSDSKVIVAENEWSAREMASNEDLGEEGRIWNDVTRVVCKEMYSCINTCECRIKI